jgi:hypothetical protein
VRSTISATISAVSAALPASFLHERLAVAFAEPIERQTHDVGAATPGRLKFRTKGDHQQHR